MKQKIYRYIEELIKIPSETGQEAVLIEHLEKKLRALGLRTSIKRYGNEVVNLEASRGKTGFVICTHADTVPLLAEFRKRGDVIEGTGSADTKGQIAALMTAIQLTNYPVHILITSDEEQGGKGSRLTDFKNPVDGILVLEPTEFKLCRLQAGAIEAKVTAKAQPYHASCSLSTENPIMRISRFLIDLDRARQPSAMSADIPSVTPYYIHSGNPDIFASPETAEMKIDIPVNPEESIDEVINQLTEAGKKHSLEVEVLDAEPGFSLSHDSKLNSVLLAAYKNTFGKEPEYAIMPSWTDGANFALKGLDVVVFGAGELKYAHTIHEHVRLDDLVKLTEFLINFLEIAAADS